MESILAGYLNSMSLKTALESFFLLKLFFVLLLQNLQ